jgi:hypothetical protein
LSQSFDLFGLPVDAGTGKPGRPRKEATVEDHNKIKMLLAIGWSVDRMASVVRMSAPTFRRIFFQELKEREFMRDRLYARRLELAFTNAEAGNIAALKELGRMLSEQDRFFAEAELMRLQSGDKQEKPAGKKAQMALAAKEAAKGSSQWGDDLQFTGRGTKAH